LDERHDFQDAFLYCILNFTFTFVGTGQTCLDNAGESCTRGGAAELNRSFDVVGHHQFLNLGHKSRCVEIEFEIQENEALDNDSDSSN